MTPLVFNLASRFTLDRARLRNAIILLALGVAISISLDLVLEVARFHLIVRHRHRPGPFFSPLEEIAHFRFLNQLVVYLTVLTAGFAREYFRRDQQRQREATLMRRRAAELQAQLSDARLDALRMQLNPHFLFNTLNAVSAMVERDPAGVRKMIARLSDLLRSTIDRKGTDEISLRDELALLQRYLDIMQIRFQDRLVIDVQTEEAALDGLVPNLILQPLLENALQHAAANMESAARIEVRALREEGVLRVTIHDNGPGLSSVQSVGGVGLRNSRQRLEQLYGDAASLRVENANEGGVIATLTVPFHTAEVETS